MKIRFAFYKYTKKPLNAFIAGWTWLPNINTPPYSHVEIGFKLENEWRYFSSTMRDGGKGTRWIGEKDLFEHSERWDIYSLKVDSTIGQVARCTNIKGRKYDVLGLTGFVFPFGLLNRRKYWYCSEACYYVLTGKWRRRVSPRGFYKFLFETYRLEFKKIYFDS